MTSVCVAGFSFEADGEILTEGTTLKGVTVRIGDGVLTGDATIRNSRSLDGSRHEIGCLFYPARESECGWMAFIAGIEAAQSTGP